jgi:excisionase family DNA binding protein
MKDDSNISPEPWVGTDEIANHLGVTVETIRKLIKAKKIPCHRVGRLWKFQISEIDKWVKSGAAGEERRYEH